MKSSRTKEEKEWETEQKSLFVHFDENDGEKRKNHWLKNGATGKKVVARVIFLMYNSRQ